MTHDFLLYRDERAVPIWLFICLLLIALMVVVGGYTRLSGSGLSITEWKPVHGVMPPTSEQAWEEEFAAYKETPQFEKVNPTMTVEEFKSIYWPEYFHRLLGRIIGAAVLIPFGVFLLRGSLSRPVVVHIGGIFLLGALQGFIGWFMVQSGLIDNPRVSHVRLALHLSIAFAIFGLIEWLWLDLLSELNWWKNRPHTELVLPKVDPLALYVLWFFLFGLQVVFGAFMAGLHAGYIYNTWPTMNGSWLPESFSGDVELVQFIHRWLAAVVVGGFLIWWFSFWRYVKNIHLFKPCMVLAALLCGQFALGVFTLINVTPLELALPHQFMALLLFAVCLYLLHRLVAEGKR